MANAKKCDRCGVYYDYIITDDNGMAFIHIYENSNYIVRKRYDLCPDCIPLLRTWLEGAESDND